MNSEVLSESALYGSIHTVSPCDKFACENRTRCAREKLVCKSYARYILSGKSERPETPTRRLYEKLYG